MRAICFALFLTLAVADSSYVRSAEGNTNARVAQVRAVMNQFFDSAKKQDWDAVGALMAPEFEMYTDQAETYNKASYIKLLKDDNLKVVKMELHDERVTVSEDGALAWMTYKGYFENMEHGKLNKVETVETMLFRRIGKRWLLARGHASIRELNSK